MQTSSLCVSMMQKKIREEMVGGNLFYVHPLPNFLGEKILSKEGKLGFFLNKMHESILFFFSLVRTKI